MYAHGPPHASSRRKAVRLTYIRPLRCGASSWPRARRMRGSGESAPTSSAVRSSQSQNGFPDPVSMTVCPYPSSGRLPTGMTRFPVVFLVPHQRPGRAILFANATATSIRGLRASIRASHEPGGAPRRTACRDRISGPTGLAACPWRPDATRPGIPATTEHIRYGRPRGADPDCGDRFSGLLVRARIRA